VQLPIITAQLQDNTLEVAHFMPDRFNSSELLICSFTVDIAG